MAASAGASTAMATWSELLYADVENILDALHQLEGIPHYAFTTLAEHLHLGYELSFSLLAALDINPIYWYQFSDECNSKKFLQ